MIEHLAIFYVDVIEPALRVLAVLAFVVTVLYVINMIKDPKKKADIIGKMFNLMISSVTGTFRILGRLVVYLLKLLLKTINVLRATIRDFFMSQI